MDDCNGYNQVSDTSEFSKPMPWLGAYSAAASLVFLVLMGADTYIGIRKRKLWFPPKYFNLNSATLFILGIASKLSVDINTPMLGKQDQLTKLTGTALLCTAMANFISSLGASNQSSIFSNLIALTMLVISVIVNICVQIHTGAIFSYIPEHIVIIIILVFFLLCLGLLAIMASDSNTPFSFENSVRPDAAGSFKANVPEICLQLYEGSKKDKIACSPFSMQSGLYSIIILAILVEASIRSFIKTSMSSCVRGRSDYQWSTVVVLVIQVLAVLVGNIAPIMRPIFSQINSMEDMDIKYNLILKHLSWGRENCRFLNYGVGYFSLFRHRLTVVFAYVLAYLVTVIVLLPWFVVIVMRLLAATCFGSLICSDCDDRAEVLQQSLLRDINEWRERGRKNKPSLLIDLLIKKYYSTLPQGFQALNEVNLLFTPNEPKCWSLTVVTLASIVFALREINENEVERILKATSEGLKYVRLLEKHVADCSKATKMWVDIVVWEVWNEIGLCDLAHGESESRKIVENLISKVEGCEDFGANYMKSICELILRKTETNNEILGWIEMTIGAAFAACLPNLPVHIKWLCSERTIEEREESARDIVLIIGELEEIFDMFNDPEVAGLCSEYNRGINA